MPQKLLFAESPGVALDNLLHEINAPGGVFVLCDTNTYTLVYPRLRNASSILASANIIVTAPGDENKDLQHLTAIWEYLQTHGATRHSLMVNIGGGMITDMGAFAAATFKRGMRWINVPTTVLGAVDAAVGGKTGINFHGYKNELGVFADAEAVLVSSVYFDTLPHAEFLSGYAEMLKHGLLKSREDVIELLNADIRCVEPDSMLSLLRKSVAIKEWIVAEDPYERGLRRALNLGHTFGHAFESLAMRRNSPVPHGYAVAWGLICSLILSHLQLGFDSQLLRQIAAFVERNYGIMPISCNDYDSILELMQHDKKNVACGRISFTLLRSPGEVELGCEVPKADILTTLDLFRDLLHI